MRLYRLIFIFIVLSFLPYTNSVAQTDVSKKDTTIISPTPKGLLAAPIGGKTDTIKIKKTLWEPNPKRAGLYAALLPGLGQAYNRQYWKIPIVYAGFSVAGYFLVKNSKEYNRYRKAYIGRINNPYPTDEFVKIYTDINQLKQLQDDYSRILNLTVLFTTVGYTLQVLDAITSAHLKNFDISRDISLRIKPVATPYGDAGIGLVMNF